MRYLSNQQGTETEQGSVFGRLSKFLDRMRNPAGDGTPISHPQPIEIRLNEPNQIILGIEVNFADPPLNAGKWHTLSKRGDKIYRVDLDSVTCSCETFSKSCANYSIISARRYCVHLLQKSIELGFCRKPTPNHELVRYYIENEANFYGTANYLHYLESFGGNTVFASRQIGSDWFNIFTRKRRSCDLTTCTGEIQKYGYTPIGNRWSHGEAPFRPIPIKKWLGEIRIAAGSNTFAAPKKIEETEFTGIRFPLDTLLTIEPSTGMIDAKLFDGAYAYLRSQADISLIRDSLTKLEHFKGVSPVDLGKEWFAHSESLSAQHRSEADFFLQQALRLAPNIRARAKILSATNLEADSNILSVDESEAARQNKFRNDQHTLNLGTVPLERERKAFDETANGKFKSEALEIINTQTPIWFAPSAGHTFFGYLYADFVREHSPPKKKDALYCDKIAILDYLASLAILDNTISNNVMATMFRLKGEFALNRGNNAPAISYFRRALFYNPNIGVKNILRTLERRENALTDQ